VAHFPLTADESRLTLSAHEEQGSSMSVTAAAIGGGLEGRPRQSRILRIASGGWIAARILVRAPHRGMPKRPPKKRVSSVEPMSNSGDRFRVLSANFWCVSGDVTVRLNTEFFEQTMDPAMLRELVTVWQGEAIAKATLYHNMERSGLTRPGVDFEQAQQRFRRARC